MVGVFVPPRRGALGPELCAARVMLRRELDGPQAVPLAAGGRPVFPTGPPGRPVSNQRSHTADESRARIPAEAAHEEAPRTLALRVLR